MSFFRSVRVFVGGLLSEAEFQAGGDKRGEVGYMRGHGGMKRVIVVELGVKCLVGYKFQDLDPWKIYKLP